MRRTKVALLIASMALVATSAFAAPIDITNTRPIAGVPTTSELQGLLDGQYGTGVINAGTDQQAAGMWQLPGVATGQTAPLLLHQQGSFVGDVAFGIWSATDTNTITRVEIFSATAATDAGATLKWASGSPNTLIIGSSDAGVNVGSFAGISRSRFGWYITSPDGSDSDGFMYSSDQLNDGGVAQMLAYVGGPTRWTFAFEDLNRNYSSDSNFVDLVVTAESITAAVPEPEIYAMLLAGLGFMGFVARRRKQQLAA